MTNTEKLLWLLAIIACPLVVLLVPEDTGLKNTEVD